MEKFSPSKIDFIEECVLRYLKHNNTHKHQGKKTFNKDTFLGIVIHAVIEDFINSPYKITKFEERWDSILTKNLKDFEELNNLEIIKYHVPYYVVKKQQTKKLLHKLKLKNPKAEFTISGSIVFGKSDLVEQPKFQKKVKITDFKTGPIWDVRDGYCIKIKNKFATQLKTYALVYWEKGFKPENIVCVLHGLSKDELVQFTFTEKEYKEHKSFLCDLKYKIADCTTNNNEFSLATPTSMACKYCDFIYSCVPFHKTLLAKPSEFESMQLINSKNSAFDDQFLKIEIQKNENKTTIQKIPNIVYHQIKESVNDNHAVLLSNLYNIINSETKNWTRFTHFKIINWNNH